VRRRHPRVADMQHRHNVATTGGKTTGRALSTHPPPHLCGAGTLHRAAALVAATAAVVSAQLSPSTAYRPPWADNIVKVQVFNAGAGAYRSMCLTPDRATLYATGSQLKPAILAVDTARLSVRDLLP
jgi:hypothetical protein